MWGETWVDDARDSYDRVAERYADLTKGALESLPLEGSLLALFAQRVLAGGGGPVVDAGCGPGWLTAQLARQGLDVSGMDVSAGLLAIARAHHPHVRFTSGSITRMPYRDASLAGVLCWFVLHHVPDTELSAAVRELARVLAPGGQLLLGGHVGESSYVKTEGYGGLPMKVLFARRTNDDYAQLLRDAGLLVDAMVALDPDTPRPTGILVARKPL